MRTPTRSSSTRSGLSRTPSKLPPPPSPIPISRQIKQIPLDDIPIDPALLEEQDDLEDAEGELIDEELDLITYDGDQRYPQPQHINNNASSSSSISYSPIPAKPPRIGIFSSQQSINTGNPLDNAFSSARKRAKPARSLTSSSSTLKSRSSYTNGKGKGKSNVNPIPIPRSKPNVDGRLVAREKHCSFCPGTDERNRKNEKEKMVSCYDCGRSGHPSCLNMFPPLNSAVMNYRWQCLECKTCEACKVKGDDSKLMFCDGCDRGWHSYCLVPKLAKPPEGPFHCPLCVNKKTSIPSTSRSMPNLPHSTSTSRKGKDKAISYAEEISTPTARPRKSKHESIAIDSEDDIYDEIIPTSSIKVKVPKQREPDKLKSISKDKRRKTNKEDFTHTEDEGTPMIVRLKLPSNTLTKGNHQSSDPVEPEEEKIPYGGVITGELADTSKTSILEIDKEDYEKSKKLAENRLGGPPPLNTSSWDISLNSPLNSPSLNSGRSGSPIQTPNKFTSTPSNSKLNGSTSISNSSSRPLRDRLLQQSLTSLESPGYPFPNIPITPISHHGHHHSGPQAKLEKINKIRFGQFDIDTWFAAPYPEEYVHLQDGRLWLCEFCLKYMKSGFVAGRHRLKCKVRHPPGDEIYRDGSVSVFEVDGRKNKIYCQNLCLLAKMFLDHKTLYYDVEPFLFYVMTEVDELGARFVGYFSKEKRSMDNNVSCIMALPVRQRKGWGQLLIDFSYLLSKKEGRVGTPEKPLSGLGAVTYRAYWRLTVFRYLSTASSRVTLEDISLATSMTLEDILTTLRSEDMITEFDPNSSSTQTPNSFKTPKSRNRSRGNGNSTNRRNTSRVNSNEEEDKIKIPKEYSISIDKDYILAILKKHDDKGYLTLRPERLKYHPFLVTRDPTLTTEQRTEATLQIIGHGQNGESVSQNGNDPTSTSNVINGDGKQNTIQVEESPPPTEEEINKGKDQATLNLVAELAASPIRSLRRKREDLNKNSISPIRNVRSRRSNGNGNLDSLSISPSISRRDLRGNSIATLPNSVNGRISSLSPLKKTSSLDSLTLRRKRVILSESEEEVEEIEYDKSPLKKVNGIGNTGEVRDKNGNEDKSGDGDQNGDVSHTEVDKQGSIIGDQQLESEPKNVNDDVRQAEDKSQDNTIAQQAEPQPQPEPEHTIKPQPEPIVETQPNAASQPEPVINDNIESDKEDTIFGDDLDAEGEIEEEYMDIDAEGEDEDAEGEEEDAEGEDDDGYYD